MLDLSNAVIAEIVDFEIHAEFDPVLVSIVGSATLSASIEVKINEEYYVFGGPSMFISMPNQGSDFFGHFVMRCMQTVGVKTTREMEGEMIKVIINDGKVYAICSLRNDNFFSPVEEFEQLEKGVHNNDE
jgi:hypothetical protein